MCADSPTVINAAAIAETATPGPCALTALGERKVMNKPSRGMARQGQYNRQLQGDTTVSVAVASILRQMA